jgi:hypothetical protein
MKGCGVSLVGLVLGGIVSLWILFHIGTIWHYLNVLLKFATGH